MIWYWVAFITILVTSATILLSRDWRWNLGGLGIQYLAIFWLVHVHWSLSISSIILITGWMACTVIGITLLSLHQSPITEETWIGGGSFYWFGAILAIGTSYALAIKTAAWLSIDIPLAWGGLLLISMGLLYLGMSNQVFRVIVGLLTALSGFEVLYASVESSILVAVLLAVVTLGLALVGAYLLQLPLSKEGA
jgi:hypothetical protein